MDGTCCLKIMMIRMIIKPNLFICTWIFATFETLIATSGGLDRVHSAHSSRLFNSSNYLSLSPTLLQLPPPTAAACPGVCFCNLPSRIVYCSRRGLPAIPTPHVAADTLQLNVNGNEFRSRSVGRSNLTGYPVLEHLYMSECGLEELEVGAFSGLIELKWLDLSHNRIKHISEKTFSGLSLQHLFLNGNRHIHLLPDSFEGLATTGLYLHDCALTSLPPETLDPLNDTLRYLWLNGNDLQDVDPRLLPLFERLIHLRLASNPLRCTCGAVWLKRFYDRHGGVFGGAAPPSCHSPSVLRSRGFNSLTSGELRCRTPSFTSVDAHMDTDWGGGGDEGSRGVGVGTEKTLAGASRRFSAQLRCVATGEPAPVLFWIQPSGKTTKFGPSSDENRNVNEALIIVDLPHSSSTSSPPLSSTSSHLSSLSSPKFSSSSSSNSLLLDLVKATGEEEHAGSWPKNEKRNSNATDFASTNRVDSGMYICIAANEAGNVTLTISLPWRPTRPGLLQRLPEAQTDRRSRNPSVSGSELLGTENATGDKNRVNGILPNRTEAIIMEAEHFGTQHDAALRNTAQSMTSSRPETAGARRRGGLGSSFKYGLIYFDSDQLHHDKTPEIVRKRGEMLSSGDDSRSFSNAAVGQVAGSTTVEGFKDDEVYVERFPPPAPTNDPRYNYNHVVLDEGDGHGGVVEGEVGVRPLGGGGEGGEGGGGENGEGREKIPPTLHHVITMISSRDARHMTPVLFSVSQLATAVLLTHVVTLVVCVTAGVICYDTDSQRRKRAGILGSSGRGRLVAQQAVTHAERDDDRPSRTGPTPLSTGSSRVMEVGGWKGKLFGSVPLLVAFEGKTPRETAGLNVDKEDEICRVGCLRSAGEVQMLDRDFVNIEAAGVVDGLYAGAKGESSVGRDWRFGAAGCGAVDRRSSGVVGRDFSQEHNETLYSNWRPLKPFTPTQSKPYI